MPSSTSWIRRRRICAGSPCMPTYVFAASTSEEASRTAASRPAVLVCNAHGGLRLYSPPVAGALANNEAVA